MKRNLFLILAIAASISLTGCVTVKKVVRERVDQDVSGNQGYLKGSSDTLTEPGFTKREYIDIKIEIPTWKEISAKQFKQDKKPGTAPRKKTGKDTKVTGNRGYLQSSGGVEESLPVHSREPSKAATVYEYDEIEAVIVTDDKKIFYEEEVIRPAYQEYIVKKGDTLSHIAKAFYNKASKWTVIYEANTDKLKDPSNLMPGTVLIIPNLEEAVSEYIK
jgi:LysM repeat protein